MSTNKFSFVKLHNVNFSHFLGLCYSIDGSVGYYITYDEFV
jgi:hypothetical protein